jgi:hypothetical protein
MSLGNDRFQCSEPRKTFRSNHKELEEQATQPFHKCRQNYAQVFHMERFPLRQNVLTMFHVEHLEALRSHSRSVPRGTLGQI